MFGKSIRISVSLYLLLIMFCGMQIVSSALSLGIVSSELSSLERIDLGSKNVIYSKPPMKILCKPVVL